MPPESAQAPAPGGEGGGIADAIAQTDAMISKITEAVTQNAQLPDEVKQAFQGAAESWKGAVQALTGAAGGGEQGPPDGGPGAVPAEAGASGGAVPMSHQMMRGK